MAQSGKTLLEVMIFRVTSQVSSLKTTNFVIEFFTSLLQFFMELDFYSWNPGVRVFYI